KSREITAFTCVKDFSIAKTWDDESNYNKKKAQCNNTKIFSNRKLFKFLPFFFLFILKLNEIKKRFVLEKMRCKRYKDSSNKGMLVKKKEMLTRIENTKKKKKKDKLHKNLQIIFFFYWKKKKE
ncbi:hypothetical protein RFI_27342, partial [Reticulomyxa filosa]